MSYHALGCIGCLVGLGDDVCPPDPASGKVRVYFEGDCRTEEEIAAIMAMKEHGKTVDTVDGLNTTTALVTGAAVAIGLGCLLLWSRS